MARMRVSLFIIIIELLLILLSSSVYSSEIVEDTNVPVVILVDRSYSMTESLNGQPKFKIVRAAFRELAHQFQGQNNVSVRFFAGGRNKQDSTINCQASELSIPLGQVVDVQTMEQLIAGVRPLGRKTNITFAIEAATKDLERFERGKIILLSDGSENCLQDPIGLAESLAAQNIAIDTIGIGPPGQFAELGRIALAGAGEFQSGTSAGEIASAIAGSMPDTLTDPVAGAMDNFQAASVPATMAYQEAARSSMATPKTTNSNSSNSIPMIPSTPAPAVQSLQLEFDIVNEKPKDPVAVEIILDVSGSMAAKLQGQSKMVLARAALAQALRGLDSPAFKVGLRAYGFDNSVPKTAQASCPNTELLIPIATNQIASIRDKVNTLQPFGYTPIAKSLLLAGDDLKNTSAGKQMIILISDGEETCAGDPVLAAKKLREMGIDVETHVIGFDLDKVQAEQMHAIAAAGQGQYYDAKGADELKKALVRVVEIAQNKIDPTWLRDIHPIAGGTTPETAVDLLPGTYTLQHFLEKGTQLYFRVNTKKAQYGIIRGLIQSRRLIRDGDDVVESSQGFAQYRLSLYQIKGKKNRGRFVRLSGEPGEFGHVGFNDTQGDGFIFTIGSVYDRVHKDALFNIEIIDSGDKYQGHEAPDSIDEQPLVLTVDDNIIGHLGDGDITDTYKVVTSEIATLTNNATTYVIDFTPDDIAFKYRIKIKSSSGKNILTKASKGERVQLSVSINKDAQEFYIEIKSNNPNLKSRFTAYRLQLKAVDNE